MKANLLLVLHFHQPVGNFDDVIKRVYDKCYRPFLEAISQYPQIKLNLHFSGSLLDWFESNNPEILGLVKKMVKRNQAELLGGAIYEPILSLIPKRDIIGQIKLMRQHIDYIFDADVKGAWIPERVWEPHLVSSLAKAGIDYTILDDTHFLYAGLKKEDTYGYYISEDNGNTVAVFPSDKPLRYTIPFSRPEESFAYMKKVAENLNGAIFTYGDDIEKFGEWPGTYKLVYEDKWLARFFKSLVQNRDWLRTLTLSECVKEFTPRGRVYLPTASYEEMLEWALPIDAEIAFQDIKNELQANDKKEIFFPFIRGGFFRNFLTKYYEANQMHKRMLYVSNLLSQLKENGFKGTKLKDAYKELYKGQCNCAYWHGLFGGLYLYHLRQAVYRHLLQAEKIYNDIKRGAKRQRHEVIDFDMDGFKEIILQNKKIWFCAKPSLGGIVIEFDVKERCFNLLNVLTRYREFYHKGINKKLEEGKKLRLRQKKEDNGDYISKLAYDKYQKSMFVDHFFDKKTTLEDFKQADYVERGDFINSPYNFKVIKNENKLVMERRGLAYGENVKIAKKLSLKNSNLNVVYNITNLGKVKKKFHFGTEIPFIMPDADSPRYTYRVNNWKENSYAIDSSGATDGLKELEIGDSKGELSILLNFSKECRLWRFPILTISQCEKGYEENYQGSVILPNWNFTLDPNKTFRLEIELSVVS
jgi:alpha-amylase